MEHQIKRGVKEGNAGSLHSHVLLFDDEYIPFNAINKAWGKGIQIFISLMTLIMSVLMCLNILLKRLMQNFNRHSYHISRGLPKPSEYCHDGYITDIDFGKEILDQVDWYHIHTTNYEYKTSDGIFQNSILYKQGRFKKWQIYAISVNIAVMYQFIVRLKLVILCLTHLISLLLTVSIM